MVQTAAFRCVALESRVGVAWIGVSGELDLAAAPRLKRLCAERRSTMVDSGPAQAQPYRVHRSPISRPRLTSQPKQEEAGFCSRADFHRSTACSHLPALRRRWR